MGLNKLEYSEIVDRIEKAANLYLQNNEQSLQQAVIIVNEISEEYPEIGVVQNNLGTALTKIRKFDVALTYYFNAIECGLVNSEIFTSIGICYENLRNYELAIENFNMAISLDESNDRSYFLRGRCYKHLGFFEQYNMDNRKAVELNFFG